MAFFWVNLGTTHKEVKEHSFLWAPAHTTNINGQKHIDKGWKAVPTVSKEDVIFCHYKGKIIYIAKAIKDAYESERPKGRFYDEWKKDGYKIEVDLEVLSPPLQVDIFKETFINRYNLKCSPKVYNTTDNRTTQNYMSSIPNPAAILIASYLGEFDTEFKTPSKSHKKINKTQREVIASARVGQGKFREEVLSIWNWKCPITDISTPGLLVASHIYPWALSTDEERLDEYNGFPFSPDIDKLFDRGFISFEDTGELIIHQDFTRESLEKLGIQAKTKIRGLSRKHTKYLKKHRELFGFLEV